MTTQVNVLAANAIQLSERTVVSYQLGKPYTKMIWLMIVYLRVCIKCEPASHASHTVH